MAEGYRITEDGNTRHTESSAVRVTEGTLLSDTSLSGAGALTTSAMALQTSSAYLSGSGAIVPTGTATYSGEFVASFSFPERETEDEDARVTEDGIPRILDLYLQNAGNSSIVARSNLIVFNSLPYINVSGDWKTSAIFVKNNDKWAAPEAVYKNVGGRWKRVY